MRIREMRTREMIWVVQLEEHLAADKQNRDFTFQRFQHGARRKLPKRKIVKHLNSWAHGCNPRSH
jgi:hypothetical protein